MLRRITDMPAGTIGFEAVGEVEDDDWEETVEPVLRQEIAAGRNVRLLYLIGTAAREVEGDAMSADTGFRVRHATSYERVAVVSDEDWIRPRCAPFPSCFPERPMASASVIWPRQRLGLRRTEPSGHTRAACWLATYSDHSAVGYAAVVPFTTRITHQARLLRLRQATEKARKITDAVRSARITVWGIDQQN